MPNGQPLVLGMFNTATLRTSLSATAIPGANQAAFAAVGPKAGVGLLGRALAIGPNLLGGEVGVAGEAQTTGVFGQSAGGMLVEDGTVLIAGAGVAGRSGSNGVGVHGAASAGFGVLGQDASGIGVMGKAVSGIGVRGESNGGPGVSGHSPAQPGVRGESTTSQGVYGKSASSAGVAGISTSYDGVYGRSASGIGVHGLSASSIGVYGSGAGEPGVRGDSNSNAGVLGMSATGVGVHGWSTGGAAGVSGYCAAGRGLHGRSVSGTGVFAESSTGIAILGMQNSSQISPAHGVVGFSQTGYGVAAASMGQPSLYAVAGNNLAALFKGDVEVRGAFKVVGGPKSAVVPHRDGTHRQLYCVESPESWFEDFGEAEVVAGACSVALDADFAALVRSDDYQVFLTPYGPAALYVSQRSAKGFEIRALPDARGGVPAQAVRCGYRVVARRKDIEAPRLARVKLADAPALDLPKLGKPRPEKAPGPVGTTVMKEPRETAAPKVPPPPKALAKALLARRQPR